MSDTKDLSYFQIEIDVAWPEGLPADDKRKALLVFLEGDLSVPVHSEVVPPMHEEISRRSGSLWNERSPDMFGVSTPGTWLMLSATGNSKGSGADNLAYTISGRARHSISVNSGAFVALHTPGLGQFAAACSPEQGPRCMTFTWKKPKATYFRASFLTETNPDLQVLFSSSDLLRATALAPEYGESPIGLGAEGTSIPEIHSRLADTSRAVKNEDRLFAAGVLLGVAGGFAVEAVLLAAGLASGARRSSEHHGRTAHGQASVDVVDLRDDPRRSARKTPAPEEDSPIPAKEIRETVSSDGEGTSDEISWAGSRFLYEQNKGLWRPPPEPPGQ
ncbi:hypothetical protein [Kineosporia succinea]|uniref:Uncharacterized protein n=1 Tax=Kineosporia succinea TaxID=84632 RepID=A0ABT9NYD3_9ACTN|nr:hypothetical protein [Kineosporia succinea]MDP9825000.1 hypothetical protein [Kineosporia succinea]